MLIALVEPVAPPKKVEMATTSPTGRRRESTEHEISMIKALEGLKEVFVCPICCEMYTEPVMYPCMHSNCANCARLAMQSKVECPICKQSVSSLAYE